MLQLATVEPNTLDILKKLMSIEKLKEFVLVGGTSLALQYGHRKSVDLDLFSLVDVSMDEVAEELIKEFPGISITGKPKFGLFAWIGNLKVDLINYGRHTPLNPFIVEDNIRLASPEDIAAMKIYAILQRGKKKDFWDISLLLDKFGLEKIIEFYTTKYPGNRTLISIPRCLVYFDDAEESENPQCLRGLTWNGVKRNIQKHVNNYLK